jgi:hypothetical protein
MANVVYCNNSNFCKNNYFYTLATEFVPNPPPMLPAHHTGIANSGSNGHYFAPNAPVANYYPQAPIVGVRVANGCPECLVASATLASATALHLAALSGHVMPNFPHALIGLGLFTNQDCTIVFTQITVTVYHPDGHSILSGWRNETGPRLWHFLLTTKAANPQDANRCHSSLAVHPNSFSASCTTTQCHTTAPTVPSGHSANHVCGNPPSSQPGHPCHLPRTRPGSPA